MDTEEKLRCQFRQNWSKMKEEISPRWSSIADWAFEKYILDFADYEKIKYLQNESEKVEDILSKVVKLRKCTAFYEMLEEIGFKRLCKEVENTDVDEDKLKDTSSNSNERRTPSNQNDTVNSVVHHIKQDLLTRDELLYRRLEEREDILHTKLDEKFREIDKRLDNVGVERKRFAELYDQWSNLEAKYTHLQTAYQNARESINKLTALSKEKNFENHALKQRVSELEKIVADLESHQTLDSDRAAENELLAQQKEEVSQLDGELKEKCQELDALRKKFDELQTLKQTITDEISDVKKSLEQLRKETKVHHQDDERDKADQLMKRLERLLNEQTYDGISGRSAFATHPVRSSFGRR